jgi:hypothetical protein
VVCIGVVVQLLETPVRRVLGAVLCACMVRGLVGMVGLPHWAVVAWRGVAACGALVVGGSGCGAAGRLVCRARGLLGLVVHRLGAALMLP